MSNCRKSDENILRTANFSHRLESVRASCVPQVRRKFGNEDVTRPLLVRAFDKRFGQHNYAEFA